MEIERKFLLAVMPSLKDVDSAVLRQGYISTDPTIRLRSEGDKKYYLTIKGRGRMAHEEYELEITDQQFKKLWKKIEGHVIEKIRYRIPLDGGLVAELDEYLGRLKGFYTVEVEFKTVDEAKSFVPPDWFGRDVTNDPQYKNSALSKGIPIGL